MPDLNTRKKLMEDLKNIGSFDKQGNTRDAFHDIMEKMAEEGMITMADGKKPGRNDLDYDELDRMFIRVNDNDDPYTFNATDADELDNGNKHIYSADLTEKPLTKEEYAEKVCGKAPKKPGFFRKMLDGIKKNVFRMKDGDKQCRDRGHRCGQDVDHGARKQKQNGQGTQNGGNGDLFTFFQRLCAHICNLSLPDGFTLLLRFVRIL